MSDSDPASCAPHHAEAIGTCARCGAFLCKDCAVPYADALFCEPCVKVRQDVLPLQCGLTTTLPGIGLTVGALSLVASCVPALPLVGILLNLVVLAVEQKDESARRRRRLFGLLGLLLSLAGLAVQIRWYHLTRFLPKL